MTFQKSVIGVWCWAGGGTMVCFHQTGATRNIFLIMQVPRIIYPTFVQHAKAGQNIQHLLPNHCVRQVLCSPLKERVLLHWLKKIWHFIC